MSVEVLMDYIQIYGGFAIFIIVLLEYMNLPGFPAGIIMPLAGIYAAGGKLGFFTVILISTAAGLLGSWILYGIGYGGGKIFLSSYLKKFPKQEAAVNRTVEMLQGKGYFGIFLSKLIPMVRTLISIPAGVLRMNFLGYTIASLCGVLVWNVVFVGAGYIIGEPVIQLLVRG